MRAALLGFAALLLTLALSTMWTIAATIERWRGRGDMLATHEVRREGYPATATALGIDIAPASLKAGSGFVQRLQDTAAATPPPAVIELPKLLIPKDPASGAEYAGVPFPTRAPPIRRDHRLINIMLLGSDDELTADSFIRTDTMILVSLNLDAKTVNMLSLPRDLFVYIVHGEMGRLNTAYGIGEYLGWSPGGGFGLLRQTLFYNFGINAHYYARVSFSGFEAIIDSLGGVDIAVDCAYRDYYPASVGEGEIEYRWRALPVGMHSFDGFDALWYARIRRNTDDIDRGRRQQQLLRSIWRKARSQDLLTAAPRLWRELSAVIDTNLTLDILLQLLPFFIDFDLGSLDNLTFAANYHTSLWTTPAGAEVLLPQAPAVARLMRDFYTPPSPYQAALASPSIGVRNGSGNAGWDLVASERLRWGGYNALALGAWEADETLPSSLLLDHIATEKGSLVPGLLRALNMDEEQVSRAPKADRQYDYEVVLGEDYKSCTFGVLPFED